MALTVTPWQVARGNGEGNGKESASCGHTLGFEDGASIVDYTDEIDDATLGDVRS
jgi:hypothetical protein